MFNLSKCAPAFPFGGGGSRIMKTLLSGLVKEQNIIKRDGPLDRLFCGLVVRVPGYRSKDPGFDTRRYQIF
jgi:hypothetical protein